MYAMALAVRAGKLQLYSIFRERQIDNYVTYRPNIDVSDSVLNVIHGLIQLLHGTRKMSHGVNRPYVYSKFLPIPFLLLRGRR